MEKITPNRDFLIQCVLRYMDEYPGHFYTGLFGSIFALKRQEEVPIEYKKIETKDWDKLAEQIVDEVINPKVLIKQVGIIKW